MISATGEERTVYVVDDDDAVRDALAMLFRTAGLSVETFPSAVAFLRVSYRTVQRMEDDKLLRRCSYPSAEVMYKARDVLKLASAPGKEA